MQGGVINNIADVIAVSAFSYYAGRYVVKNRAKIADKFGLKPKPVVVSMNPANLSIKAAQAKIKAGSALRAAGRVRTQTPSLSMRLLDEGLEWLSLLPRPL
jgi:hypothetical protein